MLYQLHEKLFSPGEDFIIQDERGNDCYLVLILASAIVIDLVNDRRR